MVTLDYYKHPHVAQSFHHSVRSPSNGGAVLSPPLDPRPGVYVFSLCPVMTNGVR